MRARSRAFAHPGDAGASRSPASRRLWTGLRQAPWAVAKTLVPLTDRTLHVARQQLQAAAPAGEDWHRRFGEEERLRFRYSGQRLLGLLIQYGSRAENGEAFLDEARRLAADYGRACCQAGMSMVETVRTFLFFGHHMLSAVQQAGNLGTEHDAEGLALYQRMSDFLDATLLATVESYCHPTPTLEG